MATKLSNKEIKHTFSAELNSAQRSYLKGLAHHLKPLVQVGDDGFSESVIKEINNCLDHHELIKVQLPGSTSSELKKQETEKLLSLLSKHCHFVGRLGRIVILYLEKDPNNEAKIELKKAKKVPSKL